MKKIFPILLLLIILLGFSGCTPTTYAEQGKDYVYGVGETINILDKESNQILSSVVITNVIIIKDEPFTIDELVKYDESNNPIYEKFSYEAVVQINYKYTVADSTKTISSSNFSVFDQDGNSAEFSPKTNYEKISTKDNSFVVAVKEKGEFVDLSFSYHISQTAVAQIKAYYEDVANKSVDENKQNQGAVEQNINTPIVDDNPDNSSQSAFDSRILVMICVVQALSNMILITVLIIVLFVKRRDRTQK